MTCGRGAGAPPTAGDGAHVTEGLWSGRCRSARSGDGGARPAALEAVHSPGMGPAVHLCVAAGPGDSRRPPQVRQRARRPGDLGDAVTQIGFSPFLACEPRRGACGVPRHG